MTIIMSTQTTITTQARAIVALDDELRVVLQEIEEENRRHSTAIERLHQRGRALEDTILKLGNSGKGFYGK